MAEPRHRYSTVSLTLHWGLALLVVLQIVLITIYEGYDASDDPMAGTYIGLHKSVGLTILVLTLARLLWRIFNPAIPLPDATPRWQKIIARSSHVLFYILLIGLPLGGWAASSAAGRAIEWFGLFTWPGLPVPLDRDLAKTFITAHGTGVKVLYVLIGLHVLGALKHHFVNRDNVLHRMLPFIRRRP
ncbi:cytochrome b [uncultured Brevundimonas sp.]|uniref:cytochrome b n=1 Tax=uncultured Brevundimonas sp. TaxID=213418 RepID=UPI0030ED0715|tara:strand:+ start:136910 stop:137470 length:561 start_codon:yes stop_codon:yes gene_type:complete